MDRCQITENGEHGGRQCTLYAGHPAGLCRFYGAPQTLLEGLDARAADRRAGAPVAPAKDPQDHTVLDVMLALLARESLAMSDAEITRQITVLLAEQRGVQGHRSELASIVWQVLDAEWTRREASRALAKSADLAGAVFGSFLGSRYPIDFSKAKIVLDGREIPLDSEEGIETAAALIKTIPGGEGFLRGAYAADLGRRMAAMGEAHAKKKSDGK